MQLLPKALITISLAVPCMALAFPVLGQPVPTPATETSPIELILRPSSEDFFEQGREQFELEIQRLQSPPESRDNLLTIDPKARFENQRQQLDTLESLDQLIPNGEHHNP